MIASVIGKTFLKEYNKRNRTEYSAEHFFRKIFHPLFYDHEKYMQWVQNSPFVQGVRKNKPFTPKERAEKVNVLATKINTYSPDASFAIGFPAAEEKNGKVEFQTTSAQVSSLPVSFEVEDIYASWLGGGLSIGLQGGYSLLFNNSKILFDVFEGWEYYRSFLNEYKNLKGNQVETWNGQWLAYRYSADFNSKNPAAGMVDFMETDKSGVISFATQSWTELLFGISKQLKLPSVIGYVFSFGQTNKTVGFIPFRLPDIERPLQFYTELFGENEFWADRKKIQMLYGTAFSFARACEKGAVGIPALEPKDLKQYMNQGAKSSKLPDYAKAKKEQIINFNVYQTWLLAMLGKKEYWAEADKIALTLLDFELKGLENNKVTTKFSSLVEEILRSSSKRHFINNITEIVNVDYLLTDAMNAAVLQVHHLPADTFIYFLTLVKFRYGDQKEKRNRKTQNKEKKL